MRPFEPADVVAAFKSKGLRPWINFHANFSGETVGAIDNCCCALTALVVGEPIEAARESEGAGPNSFSVIAATEKKWPGFDAWVFVAGFDDSGFTGNGNRPDRQHPTYRLGAETREAVEAEFGPRQTWRPDPQETRHR